MESVIRDPFPASTKQVSGLVGGVATASTVVSFADKIIITVSQDGRLAQWFHVPLNMRHPSTLTQSVDDDDGLLPLTHLTPTTLLGAGHDRESLGQLISVQLASAISMRDRDESRTVVVGLGLQKPTLDSDSFIQLIELVGRCL